MSCDWLPELVLLEDSHGVWERYLDIVYSHFHRDFVSSRPAFRGSRLGLRRETRSDGKQATFWHMITEGRLESERTPDLRRCERIRWPRPVIEHCDDGPIKVWEEDRQRGDRRVHLWFEGEDYLVVLARRRTARGDEYLLPWTAFPVDYDHTRRKLQRRYEEFGPRNG